MERRRLIYQIKAGKYRRESEKKTPIHQNIQFLTFTLVEWAMKVEITALSDKETLLNYQLTSREVSLSLSSTMCLTRG